jgi:hypothetical protein
MNMDIVHGGIEAHVVLALAFALPGIARVMEMSYEEKPHELGEVLAPIATLVTSVYGFFQWGLEGAIIAFVASRLGWLAFSSAYELAYNTRYYNNPFATFTTGYNSPPPSDRISVNIVASETCTLHLDLPARNKLIPWTGKNWKAIEEEYALDLISGLNKRLLASFDWNLYSGPRMLRKKHVTNSSINFFIEAVKLPNGAALLAPDQLKAAADNYIQAQLVEPFYEQSQEYRILTPSDIKELTNSGEFVLAYQQRHNIQDDLHYVELAQFIALDNHHMLVIRVEYYRENDTTEPPSLTRWVTWLQDSWKINRNKVL